MLDQPTGLLEIAKTVLKPETIADIRIRKYTGRGYSILDRWALNSPDELRKLEAQGPIELNLKLYRQQQTEMRALLSPQAQRMSQQGLSDWEILQVLGIEMSLTITE